jgi:hypothetical protein
MFNPKSAMQWLLFLMAVMATTPALALDSYRYFHVTIETPWAIFLFLLPIVLFPLILMAILYWRFANRKRDVEEPAEQQSQSVEKKLMENDN